MRGRFIAALSCAIGDENRLSNMSYLPTQSILGLGKWCTLEDKRCLEQAVFDYSIVVGIEEEISCELVDEVAILWRRGTQTGLYAPSNDGFAPIQKRRCLRRLPRSSLASHNKAKIHHQQFR
jgi:hypothetical protein